MKIDIPDYNVPFLQPNGLINTIWYEKLKLLFESGSAGSFDRSGVVAGDTGLLLWDVDNGAIERVTVGAAGSGGVGFKLLRIPN